jgi:hypothetical protein
VVIFKASDPSLAVFFTLLGDARMNVYPKYKDAQSRKSGPWFIKYPISRDPLTGKIKYKIGKVWFQKKLAERAGEIFHLAWAKVDLANRVIRLEAQDAKTTEPRVVFLCDQAYDILKSWSGTVNGRADSYK